MIRAGGFYIYENLKNYLVLIMLYMHTVSLVYLSIYIYMIGRFIHGLKTARGYGRNPWSIGNPHTHVQGRAFFGFGTGTLILDQDPPAPAFTTYGLGDLFSHSYLAKINGY